MAEQVLTEKIRVVTTPLSVPERAKDFARNRDNGFEFLHRVIAQHDGIDLTKYRIVHLNGDGLDNRRENLVAVPRDNYVWSQSAIQRLRESKKELDDERFLMGQTWGWEWAEDEADALHVMRLLAEEIPDDYTIDDICRHVIDEGTEFMVGDDPHPGC